MQWLLRQLLHPPETIVKALIGLTERCFRVDPKMTGVIDD